MEELKENIAFRLVSIKTDEFATFSLGKANGIPDLIVDVTFSSDLDKRLVACIMKFQFSEEEQILIALKATCIFEVEESSWMASIVKAEKFVIPKNIGEHFCVITVGAARGILHSRTENTSFNKYIIPTLNITQLIHSDIEFLHQN